MLWFGLMAIGMLALGLVVVLRRSERESVLAVYDELEGMQATVEHLEARVRALEAIAAEAPLPEPPTGTPGRNPPEHEAPEHEAPSPAAAPPRTRTNA